MTAYPAFMVKSEFEEPRGRATFYETVVDLKTDTDAWEDNGIVKVEVILAKVIEY